MLLALDDVTTYYGKMRILEGISIQVDAGELVCLLGGNASGKSTTLKTVLGIVQPRNGAVYFAGEDVTARSTSYRIRQGIAIVPENRRLFGPMTVLENLEMGAYLHGGGAKEDFERVYSLFPLLYERRAQLAGTLSGGEQQMVAMGRALMAKPRDTRPSSRRPGSSSASSSAGTSTSSRTRRTRTSPSSARSRITSRSLSSSGRSCSAASTPASPPGPTGRS